jgi:hypothetical protein
MIVSRIFHIKIKERLWTPRDRHMTKVVSVAAVKVLPTFTSYHMEARTPRDHHMTKVVSVIGPRCPLRPLPP